MDMEKRIGRIQNIASNYPQMKAISERNVDVLITLIDFESLLEKLDAFALLVLKKVYYEGYTQTQVAKDEGVSRRTLSTLIKNAFYIMAREEARREEMALIHV